MWRHFSSIGSILASIATILKSIVTILASIEQVNTPLLSSLAQKSLSKISLVLVSARKCFCSARKIEANSTLVTSTCITWWWCTAIAIRWKTFGTIIDSTPKVSLTLRVTFAKPFVVCAGIDFSTAINGWTLFCTIFWQQFIPGPYPNAFGHLLKSRLHYAPETFKMWS